MNCLIGLLVILATTTVEAFTSENLSNNTETFTAESVEDSTSEGLSHITQLSTTTTEEDSTSQSPSNIPDTYTTTTADNVTSQSPSNTNEISPSTTPRPSSDRTIKSTSLPSSTTTASVPAPDNYTVTLGKTPVALPMSISLFTEINDTINISDKEQYRNVSERIEKDLTKQFEDLPGFQRIEITDLKKGSIIAAYRLIISAEKLKEAVYQIGTFEEKLVKAKIAGRKVNETYTKDAMQTALETNTMHSSICASLNVHDRCKYGYDCQVSGFTTIICVSQCSQKPGFCENHGFCFVDSRDDKLKCRCHDDDTYAYSGDLCEIKTEKLKMESNYIIAIAASCGGVLVLIILILAAVLLWRRKKQANKEYKEENHRSVSKDDLQLQKFDDGSYNGYQGYHPRSPTAGRVYDSGLPDSRIIRGREHKVLKDDRGSGVSHGNQGYHPRSPTAGRVYDSGLPDSRIIRGREHKVLKDDRGSEVSHGNQGYHPRSPTAGRVYDSGLPDSRIIRGREHMVLKDYRGSETLIYQPSNLPRPYARSSQEIGIDNRASRVPPFYDQINADRKYELSRPQLYPPERNYSKLSHDRRNRFGY